MLNKEIGIRLKIVYCIQYRITNVGSINIKLCIKRFFEWQDNENFINCFLNLIGSLEFFDSQIVDMFCNPEVKTGKINEYNGIRLKFPDILDACREKFLKFK